MSAEQALQPDRDRQASMTRCRGHDHPSSCLELCDSECSYYSLLRWRERHTRVASVKAVTEKHTQKTRYIFVPRYVHLISSVFECLLTQMFQWMLALCVAGRDTQRKISVSRSRHIRRSLDYMKEFSCDVLAMCLRAPAREWHDNKQWRGQACPPSQVRQGPVRLEIVTRSIVVIHKYTRIHLRSPTPPLSPHLQHYRFDFFNFRSVGVCGGGSVVVGGLLYAFTFTDNI